MLLPEIESVTTTNAVEYTFVKPPLCKNCKFWSRFDSEDNGNAGLCNSPKVRHMNWKEIKGSEVFSYQDQLMTTGKNFGCVNYEERP